MQGGTDERCTEGQGSGEAKWIALRPRIGIGAVFHISDQVVRPSNGSMKKHPYVIVAGAPPVTDKWRVALGRPIQLCCRHSFRQDLHGAVPRREEEVFDLSRCGLVFSRSGSLGAFDRHGVFPARQYSTHVRELDPGDFLGWLPRDDIDSLLMRIDRPTTRMPYPPDLR